MEAKSLGCAFSQRLQQETDVRHVLHHPFRRAALVGVKIAHRGGEQHVVKRFGKLFRTDDAERAEQLGQVVLFLHGSALLSVKFDNLCGEKVEHRLVVVDARLADSPVGERKPFGLVRLCPVNDFPQYGVAHLAALQRVLHVMERHAAFLGYPLQVIQRGVLAQGGFQGQESVAVLRGGSLAGIDKRAYVASGEELDKAVYNGYAKMRVKPHGESNSDMVIGTPSTLLVRISTLADNDKIRLFRSPYLANAVFHFKSFEKLFRLCSTKPSVWSFVRSIRLCHQGKIHHAVVDTLAGHRHFVSLDVEDFNQILIREHNYKNCDKKKSPRRCALHIYAGRMMQPIVSARPP